MNPFRHCLARLALAGPLAQRWRQATLAWAILGSLAASAWSMDRSTFDAAVGLPFSRDYSLDEIGVSRGARLAFDRVGRLAVIEGKRFIVLNDATWLDIADRSDRSIALLQVVNDLFDRRSYFGALANWGEAVYAPDGTLQARSLKPAECPDWVLATNFFHIAPRPGGIYFGGINGVVFWDRASGKNTFIDVPDVSNLFTLDGRVFVSSHSLGVLEIEELDHSLRPVPASQGNLIVIDQVADLGEGSALISTTGRRLLLFDGEQFSEWSGPLMGRASGKIARLLPLLDDGVAVAIDGRGLFIVSDDGVIRRQLCAGDYLNVPDLATNEPGTLWLATENGVQRILYGDPVSVIDQRSGIPVSWPHIFEWEDQLYIVSHGSLYKFTPQTGGDTRQFAPTPNRPASGVLSFAASPHGLLVGNVAGVYIQVGDDYAPVLPGMDAIRLIMLRPDLCIVIGKSELAALEWDGSAWVERVERAPGLGFPYVAHITETSIWLELGVNRAARIAFEEGRIRTRVFDDFPWAEASWVNISLLGNIVALSGPDHERVFFDESAGALRPQPELQELLRSGPFPIARARLDKRGTIWAAHEQGVFTFHQTESGYRIDNRSLRSIRDRNPTIQFSGDDDVWISSGTALYHVNRSHAAPKALELRPVLISVTDSRSATELFASVRGDAPVEAFPYARNSLEFQFFAGGYTALRSPAYDFTMRSRSNEWSIRSTESRINLANLSEGQYHLSAQLLDGGEPIGTPVLTTFSIIPPWYRSNWAYALYWSTAIGLVTLIAAIAARHAKRKHDFLERLVQERTEDLRTTMEKLSAQERAAAILAERNRLAGEIHDSLQQGLSGLALQLEATLKLSELGAAVRSRLATAKNMVSFTRQEVQRAVWDLESPLLDNADLAEALAKMAAFISPGAPEIQLTVSGSTAHFDTSTKHHLLRIAQEAITNAARHAKAERIIVRLAASDSSAELEVRDDGCGFAPQDVLSNGLGHFGLRGMRARAAKLNGELQIESAAGSGTSILVSIPVSHAISASDDALN